ncbi:MAG: FKBP-type peptidyl-prolyl cis-trans isomerase [Gammaproteobacteria bacterium]|nr:FKBP-type peptidyl-prolyl cis-trans isomerase [Gammaproteobacteria bacterium]
MNIKSKLAHALCASVLLVATPTFAADNLKTDDQKFGYAIGFQIAQNLKNQGLSDIDVTALSQAIGDVLQGKDLQLSMEQMQEAVKAKQEKLMAERNAQGGKAKEAGEKFLAENKSKPGVKTLDNGIQYKVITEGKGEKPTLESSVVAHYRGTLIDGTEFDSSYKRGEPATFPLNGVIKGWQEVLPMMAVGSKWQVYIPSDLAYGERGAGANIGPNETLIFDIELVEVKKSAQP